MVIHLESESLSTFTVLPRGRGWAVEHQGCYSEVSPNREEATASASKSARAVIGAGGRAKVVVVNEPRSFAPGLAGSSLEWG